jgi:MscS family membrane protein
MGHWRINVTALIAGLGVGGIAVALAAQKTLENLFGGITLYADRPVRVGDFCRFGDRVGTVEEIGLRSTRIRTLDRTLVSVPNAEFSNLHLENYTARDRIWYHPTIGLRYETTPDQLRFVLVEVRACCTRTRRSIPIRRASASRSSAPTPSTSRSSPTSTRATSASTWRSPRT